MFHSGTMNILQMWT